MDPELEQRLKDFDEKKDQEFKEKIAKLDKEWPLEKRNLAITEMKAKQKTEQEWEEYKKEYLDEEDRKEIQPPQKIDEAAYYGLAGDIVKIIEPNSETDPVAILMNFLTAFGSIIGEKPYFEVEASKHRTKLFCVLVGRTSKARKGTSWDYIKYVFDGIDPEWSSQITTGLSSGEGLIWAVRDPIVKKEPLNKKIPTGDFIEVVLDQGIEDKRVLVVEPEFASTLRVLAREGNTLSPNIRNAWDTGRLQSMTKNTPAKAMNSHISILAHITIDELIKYLSDVETTNGFANRFLWFYIQRSKVLPYGGRKDIVALEQFIVKLSDAVEYAKEKEKINFDDETFELWGLLYRKLAEEKPGLIGDMFARSEPYILRLSCIYALLDHSSVIRKEHLLAATAIIDYSLASLEYIFRDSSGNEVEDGILYLFKKMRKQVYGK